MIYSKRKGMEEEMAFQDLLQPYFLHFDFCEIVESNVIYGSSSVTDAHNN